LISLAIQNIFLILCHHSINLTSSPLSTAALLTAATALGYDQEDWDRHRADPLSPPPDNLVLGMENYLEGSAYFSTYFWAQIICSYIMVAVRERG
jgi:hypothetical protein